MAGGIFGVKTRDFRKKSGIFGKKMHDFRGKRGIFGVEMRYYPATSGVFAQKMCDVWTEVLFFEGERRDFQAKTCSFGVTMHGFR